MHIHEARNDGHPGGYVVFCSGRNMNFVAMADAGNAPGFDHDDAVAQFLLRRQNTAGIDCGGRHKKSMLPEVRRKISGEPCILFLVRYNRRRTLWRELDVTRQALRGAETAAPPPQDRKRPSKTVRSGKDHA